MDTQTGAQIPMLFYFTSSKTRPHPRQPRLRCYYKFVNWERNYKNWVFLQGTFAMLLLRVGSIHKWIKCGIQWIQWSLDFYICQSYLPVAKRVTLCRHHDYRPQTKFAKVIFSQVPVCPQGGVCLWSWGCLPQPPPWADTPSQTPLQADTPLPSACWDTVNKRALHIPLECILVVVLSLRATVNLLIEWIQHHYKKWIFLQGTFAMRNLLSE